MHSTKNDIACAALSIISNSYLLREGLGALLATHLDAQIVGSYAGVPPSTPLPNPPEHVMLIDSTIGCETTMAWIRYGCGLAPQAAVLVLELVSDIDLVLACIEAGARGYTLQGASASEVAEAIRQVRGGCAFCSPAITAQLFDRLAACKTAQLQQALVEVPLTPRELEVLRYVASDYSNKEIAEALVIEVRTVKHHVHNILEKLKLQHRWEAARLAEARGWIEAGVGPGRGFPRPPSLFDPSSMI